MLKRNKLISVGIAFVLSNILAAAVPSYAQNVAEEQRKLLAEQESILKNQQQTKKLQEQLAKDQQKLNKLNAEVAPLADAKAKAKATWEEAVAEESASPGDENAAKVKNAKFKYILAERKFDKVNDKLVSVQADVTKTEKAIAQSNKDIKASQASIDKLKVSIANAEKAQKANAEKLAKERAARMAAAKKEEARKAAEAKRIAEQKQKEQLAQQKRAKELEASKARLQQQKMENAKAQAEIERLKTLLKEQKSDSSVASKGSTAAAATASVASAASKSASAAASAPKAKAAAANNASAQSANAPTDPIALAKYEDARFKDRMSKTSEKKRRSMAGRVLHMKTFRGGKEVETSSHALDYAAKGLYRTQVEVRAGENIFKVGQNEWKINIPAEDNKAQYFVNLDGSGGKLRLVVYNISNL